MAANREASTTAAPTTSCYNIGENGVHLHDLHATMLHILGIDHQRFTYPFHSIDYQTHQRRRSAVWCETLLPKAEELQLIWPYR
jgi:hypothetical protein